MNNNLHHVLEACLQEMRDGAELEAVLERYPAELAQKLRPMLLASLNAQRMAVAGPSKEVFWRNRAKLIHHAARLREVERKHFGLRFALQRWVTALVLFVVFFFSGTSLVRASSAALPGDSLYTFKRSWESFRLALTFDSEEREVLEVEHENERLEELRELFAGGRSAAVDFAGIVTRESGEGWWISNILVIVPDEVVPSGQPIQVGSAVRVYGTTRGNGIVLAERIESLPVGAALPEVEEDEYEVEMEAEEPEATVGPGIEISGPESASSTATPEAEWITGTLTSINGDIWKIDNVGIDIGNAEIKGIPVVGALARATGQYGADGIFVAVKIEIFSQGSVGSNGNLNVNDGNDDSDVNVGAQTNDDNHTGEQSNDNRHDDEHENDNDNHNNNDDDDDDDERHNDNEEHNDNEQENNNH